MTTNNESGNVEEKIRRYFDCSDFTSRNYGNLYVIVGLSKLTVLGNTEFELEYDAIYKVIYDYPKLRIECPGFSIVFDESSSSVSVTTATPRYEGDYTVGEFLAEVDKWPSITSVPVSVEVIKDGIVRVSTSNSKIVFSVDNVVDITGIDTSILKMELKVVTILIDCVAEAPIALEFN